jgi:hypothetical protein
LGRRRVPDEVVTVDQTTGSDLVRCPACESWKPREHFYSTPSRSTKLTAYCKPCQRADQRRRQQGNKAFQKERMFNYFERIRGEARSFVWDYLRDHPCTDCGEHDPLVLEFDHVGEKRATISSLLMQRDATVEEIRRELQQCEVRCANCHRRVTVERGKHWRWRYAQETQERSVVAYYA